MQPATTDIRSTLRPRPEGRAVALPVCLASPSKLSIERQLVDQLRQLIKHGALFPGARLPSSRMLADDLGCSRTPIVAAYDRLVAEGYLLSRPRSGLQVAARHAPSAPARRVSRGDVIGVSQRGQELADTQQRLGLRSGQMPGHPSIEGFPFELWGSLCTRAWRRPTSALVWGDDPAGYLPLRQAIAAHLRMVRGMVCDADQIIVTSGTRHGADLAVRVLLDPGDQVAIEDPGWPAWQVLASHGATLRPVPIDDEGMNVDELARIAPGARMVAVTPSHQFPTGIAMSQRRRLDLLDRARSHNMWILENDFDSEFQYSGEPLGALRSIDDDRVIYLGTFSKSMFPSLRLGYMVLPRHLVETFLQARSTIDGFPPMMLQPVMAAFLEEGHLARHVRNMRRLYKARHASLVAAMRRHFGDRIQIVPTCGGLTLTVLLRQGSDDVALARDARDCGLSAYPMSATAIDTPPRQGLVLGLAELPEDHVDTVVARFAALSHMK